MATVPFNPATPLDRYRALISHLVRDDDAWEDAFWLRVAAQTAVLIPDPPEALARRIRTVAEGLHRRADWFQTLSSPVRFVLAAMLLQHRIDPEDFIDTHDHIADLMTELGLRHGRFYEAVAVVILMMSPTREYANKAGMERVKALYEEMKRFHWWLTGTHDLPACAALCDCVGTPEDVVSLVEDAYQALHRAGMPHGERLQTAANLLPLAGIGIDEALDRYRVLHTTLDRYAGAVDPRHYESLALLCLLDPHRPGQEPGRVIERWTRTTAHLDDLQGAERGETNLVIAADLTFLDTLLASDRALLAEPLHAGDRALRAQPALAAYQRASAILASHLDPLQAMYVGDRGTSDWPIFWGRSPAARH